MEALNTLLQTIVSFWLFDVWVFSQWWLYAPLLIPFCFYFAFFILKWVILTAPFWLPFVIIRSANENEKEKEE